ncbi:unnamed protein product [Effrenium voratum]|nr:unnamed protein product [Effrenium voratum]
MGTELAAFPRPRDALEAEPPKRRWRLSGFGVQRLSAQSFELQSLTEKADRWQFTCQEVSEVSKWFKHLTPEASEEQQPISYIDSGTLEQAFGAKDSPSAMELREELARPTQPRPPELPSSDEETTATSSPRDSRIETLSQMELTLARQVSRFEEAVRAADNDYKELLKFFGQENSRPGGSSLLESLNDFCGQVRSAWEDLERAEKRRPKSVTTPRKPQPTPRRRDPKDAEAATAAAVREAMAQPATQMNDGTRRPGRLLSHGGGAVARAMRALLRKVGLLKRETAVQRIYVCGPEEKEEEAAISPQLSESALSVALPPAESSASSAQLEVPDEPAASGVELEVEELDFPANFREDVRSGYDSRAREREQWLESLQATRAQAATRAAASPSPQRLKAPKAALPNAPATSPLAGLRDPAEVFTEELKRWNMQNMHVAQNVQADREESRPWNGSSRMTWTIHMSKN